MDRNSSSVIAVTGLVIGIIGLLNVVLGIMAVISGAFPDAGGRPVAPPIGVSSIFFGLVILVAGALWVTSGAGYFTRKEWASTLALYIAPAIGVVNLIGVLHFWGFTIHIGWAAISTVAAMGSIWYISRKELASFFLIAVAEHVGVIIIFSMAIYAEPVDLLESRDTTLLVDIEVIDQPEPIPPEIIPQDRTYREKKPVLPKIEIRNITATDPGTKIETSMPQLPKTVARLRDTSEDQVLRSPRLKDREQRIQDTVATTDVESTLKSSKKPSIEIGPSEKTKDGPETTIARPPDSIRDSSSHDERIGPSDEVAKPSFAGKISGDIEGRKVVSWPKPPVGYEGTGGGSTTVKFWVDPAGSVTKVEISKKSGSPRLDTMARDYVNQIRFVALPRNVQQRAQWGEIPINFELTRGTG